LSWQSLSLKLVCDPLRVAAAARLESFAALIIGKPTERWGRKASGLTDLNGSQGSGVASDDGTEDAQVAWFATAARTPESRCDH
jgi:hypothetical protein